MTESPTKSSLRNRQCSVSTALTFRNRKCHEANTLTGNRAGAVTTNWLNLERLDLVGGDSN